MADFKEKRVGGLEIAARIFPVGSGGDQLTSFEGSQVHLPVRHGS